MTTALYAGSFDPVTNGHIDIIKRSAAIFDRLIVVVAINTNKQPLLTPQERVNLLVNAVGEIDNVTFKTATGLTVETFKREDANVLIRGVRNGADLDFETQIAGMNQFLDQKVETVFLPANPQWNFTSSSLIKEVIKMGGSVKGLVPEEVENILQARLRNTRPEK